MLMTLRVVLVSTALLTGCGASPPVVVKPTQCVLAPFPVPPEGAEDSPALRAAWENAVADWRDAVRKCPYVRELPRKREVTALPDVGARVPSVHDVMTEWNAQHLGNPACVQNNEDDDDPQDAGR